MAWFDATQGARVTGGTASDTDQLPIVQALREQSGAVRIVGGGTWLEAGGRWADAPPISLRAHAGIIAYEPGDLVITARAGTTMLELAHATAAHGQWIGLDPHGQLHGTVGATIATASFGPLAHSVGTPRDLVLGMEIVTGYGAIMQIGGRVVKNVAGFDLVRLFTGSWGTLGAILSVTLRLRALPTHDISCFLQRNDMDAVMALRGPTFSFLAAEWVNAACAHALGLPGAGILVRIGGNNALVTAQRDRVAALGPLETVPAAVWGALATLDQGAALVYRTSGHITSLAERRSALPDGSAAHSSIAHGVTRVVVSSHDGGTMTVPSGARVVVERAPRSVWAALPDPFASPLGQRVRTAFDPDNRCNPRVPHG
jgi:glycolate oxidase FAD binding subunit